MTVTVVLILEAIALMALGYIAVRYADAWWERYRLARPQLALADKTRDQSHTWHALICALAGALVWGAYGWHYGTDAWAGGILTAIAIYAFRELPWRVRVLAARLTRWRLERRGQWIRAALEAHAFSDIQRVADMRTIDKIAREPLRLWDAWLDVGKPLWAPGCLALAVLLGAVPTWIVATFAALSFALAYSYSIGRPRGALFYDGGY